MRLYVRQSRQQTASRVARIVDPTVDDAPAASQARNAPSPRPPPPLPDRGRAARQALADEVASTLQPLSVPSVPTEFAQRWNRGVDKAHQCARPCPLPPDAHTHPACALLAPEGIRLHLSSRGRRRWVSSLLR